MAEASRGNDPQRAAAVIDGGGLVAMPTETVYGLAADARNLEAVSRVFAAKGRPCDHPVIVHLAEASWAEDWAQALPAEFWSLAERFWPGPLTLVVPRHPGVSDLITGGQPGVALRVPSHPLTLEMLRALGRGVVAPSANRFGRISPTTADHVAADLGEELGYILDGGPCGVGLESTILDLTSEPARVLRPGRISSAELGTVLRVGEGPSSTRAPGTLERHYAPTCPAFRLDPLELSQHLGQELAVLTHSRPQLGFEPALSIELPPDPNSYGHALYASLRQLERANPRAILVENVPLAWEAVADRVRRATRPWQALGNRPDSG